MWTYRTSLPGSGGNQENEERSRKKTKLTFKASLRAIVPASPNLLNLKLRSVTVLLTCTNKTTKDDGLPGTVTKKTRNIRGKFAEKTNPNKSE